MTRATIPLAKAASHPLRLRILRLCGQQPMTNEQLADRLLVEAGLLEPAPVRTGTSGALEKPYRSTGQSWWLSGYGNTDDGEPYDDRDDESSLASIKAFQAELREAGPGSVRTFARFMLHLSEEEVRELDRRLLAVRPARPGRIVVLHQLADPAPHSPANRTPTLGPDPSQSRPRRQVARTAATWCGTGSCSGTPCAAARLPGRPVSLAVDVVSRDAVSRGGTARSRGSGMDRPRWLRRALRGAA